MFDWFNQLPSSLTQFLIFVGIAYGLVKTPVIGKYISVLNTLVHEVGHILMAILTGGRPERIKLFMNTEGVAEHRSKYWIGRLLTGFAGYTTASGTALLFVYFITIERFDIVLISLTSLFVVSFLFWVRNLYGVIWLVSFSVMFVGLLQLDNNTLNQYIVYFLTAILFVESIRTAFDILKISIKKPRDAGDATSMAQSTLIIPPQVWGVVFFLISLFTGYIGLRLFFV